MAKPSASMKQSSSTDSTLSVPVYNRRDPYAKQSLLGGSQEKTAANKMHIQEQPEEDS